MFRSNWTIRRELKLSLAKATILWNWSVKMHRYVLRCCGNKYFRLWCVYCVPFSVRRSRTLKGTPKSAAVRLLRLRVWIPPGSWMSVSSERCVLSDRGLCDKLITRPEESYRLCCVVVCDLETSRMRTPWPALGRSVTGKKITWRNLPEVNNISKGVIFL
jgi:hypothetical protein